MEQEILKILLTMFQDYPIHVQIFVVVILIVVTIITSIGSKELFKNIFEGLNGKPRRNKVKKASQLLNHDIFIMKDEYMKLAKEKMFGDDLRDYLFRTILIQKINSIHDIALQMSKNHDIKNMTKHQVEAFLKDSTREMVDLYNIRISKKYWERFGNKGNDVFEMVMNRVCSSDSHAVGFNRWHKPTIDRIIKIIEYISYADIFDNNFERIYMFYFELIAGMSSALFDAEKTFNSFNGELQLMVNDKLNKT